MRFQCIVAMPTHPLYVLARAFLQSKDLAQNTDNMGSLLLGWQWNQICLPHRKSIAWENDFFGAGWECPELEELRFMGRSEISSHSNPQGLVIFYPLKEGSSKAFKSWGSTCKWCWVDCLSPSPFTPPELFLVTMPLYSLVNKKSKEQKVKISCRMWAY